MYAPIRQIIPIAYIQRKRLLPVPGKVTVRQGGKVIATDAVAEAILEPEHILYDLARGLGVPEDEVEKYIQRKPDMEVEEGDVLAGPVGITRRVVRATRAGRVVLTAGGHLLLQVKSQVFTLRAGMSGVVTELHPDRGVTIETTGGLVQGVWGNGRLGVGQLSIVAQSPDEELTPARLDMSMRLAVLLGGACSNPEVLRLAEELPLRGLILASMSAALIPQALKMRCPVIVLDGFGRLPMNPVAYQLLSTSERNEVSINAEPWNHLTGNRPEVILSVPAGARPLETPDVERFQKGDLVRVVRQPFHGKIGELTSTPALSSLANGIVAPAAWVAFEDHQKMILPLTNLEVLK